MVSYSVHEPVDLNDGGMPPHLNTTLSGRYGVQTLLGVGRTSRVYQARVFPTDQQVAVKVLREQCNTQEDLERLKWEGDVLTCMVNSDYFARALDFGVSDGDAFLVTTAVQGQTLAKILKDFGKLSLLDALDIGIQLTEALSALHELGFVHGSFNTTDVMLTRCRQRYAMTLVDLDSAVNLDKSIPQPAPMFGEGTQFDYMSPEQSNGKPVSAKTDIYIFGLLLYEMIAGRRPFYGSSPIELLQARFNNKPELLTEIVSGIEYGDMLDEIIRMALSPDPRHRFNNISEIHQILCRIWGLVTGGQYVSPRQDGITSSGRYVCQENPTPKNWIEKITNIFTKKKN